MADYNAPKGFSDRSPSTPNQAQNSARQFAWSNFAARIVDGADPAVPVVLDRTLGSGLTHTFSILWLTQDFPTQVWGIVSQAGQKAEVIPTATDNEISALSNAGYALLGTVAAAPSAFGQRVSLTTLTNSLSVAGYGMQVVIGVDPGQGINDGMGALAFAEMDAAEVALYVNTQGVASYGVPDIANPVGTLSNQYINVLFPETALTQAIIDADYEIDVQAPGGQRGRIVGIYDLVSA